MNETIIVALEKRVTEAHAEAAAVIIRDQDSLTRANAKTQFLKALIKEIDDTFKPIYDSQKATVALTKETWDRFRIPPDNDYRRIKADIGSFLVEQDRLKREAEHRAWLAEQEKIKAEAEARRVAEEALRKAAAAEAKGRNDKAEKILNAAAALETKIAETIKINSVAAAAPIPARVQTVGISTHEDWDIELINIDLVPRDYMMFDEVKARKVIRASKGAVQIPGVKNIKKTIVSQR
jgi:predicted metal-binding transcription factor (methanogenesis marker protein 9)